MKQIICIYLLFIPCLFSCNYNQKYIKVFIENSSDIKPVINVEIYSNNKLYRREAIKKSNITNFTEFSIDNIPDSLVLRFILLETKEETICKVLSKNIHKGHASVHVNFSEVLFKKGDMYKSIKMEKDSIVKRIFYCEVMY